MATNYKPEGVPNIVLIGMPNLRALSRVARKLESNHVPHYQWIEPDDDLGFTAITTAPLAGSEREIMANYRPYKAPVAQLARAATSKVEDAGSTPAGCANGTGTEASVRP